jgi:hypothetical protein
VLKTVELPVLLAELLAELNTLLSTAAIAVVVESCRRWCAVAAGAGAVDSCRVPRLDLEGG